MLLILIVLASLPLCFCVASRRFTRVGSEIFDEWGICRTRAWGRDGFFQICEDSFRPVIVFESLGKFRDVAYELGRKFAERYHDRHRLAEAIFYFVRDHIRYLADREQFGVREYAQNADELAVKLLERGIAYGDCEDYAVLLAVMYKAAGFRVAIVLAPGHAAVLLYLPDYRRANVIWTFRGERGWIWVEATGRNNPFGWTPSRFVGRRLLAYEIEEEPLSLKIEPRYLGVAYVSIVGGGRIKLGYVSSFLTLLFLLWLMRTLVRVVYVVRRRYWY